MTERCMECLRGLATCCPIESTEPTNSDEGASNDSNIEHDTEVSSWRNPPRMRTKRDASLKDQQSTGRKRAAVLYPLARSEACEWRNASRENPMGGGSSPIINGCDGLQQQRHHGPDKNTLNNDLGNVHRICNHHHAHWHIQNDPDYDWSLGGRAPRD